jgi:hypothetical protein
MPTAGVTLGRIAGHPGPDVQINITPATSTKQLFPAAAAVHSSKLSALAYQKGLQAQTTAPKGQ